MSAVKRKKPPVILVFGEDDHDRESLGILVRALRPDAPAIKKRREPPVLVKGRAEARQKKNARDIATQARLEARLRPVAAIIAHQDADAVEPAHERLAEAIERRLEAEGFQAIGAVPAWEMETWLYLWPDAAQKVCAGWRRPARSGSDLGKLRDAKERYRQDLRPRTKNKPPRDYEESDCPRIVQAACEAGLLSTLDAKSASYERFRTKVDALKW